MQHMQTKTHHKHKHKAKNNQHNRERKTYPLIPSALQATTQPKELIQCNLRVKYRH